MLHSQNILFYCIFVLHNEVLLHNTSFKVTELAARTGRNPRAGEKMQIKAKKVVRFKAGSDLADRVK